MILSGKLPKEIREFCNVFAEHGHQCWLVGGAVRNIVLGSVPDDFDFATDAVPETVAGMFRRVIPTGIQHGTVTVLWNEFSFEVTTFRIDGTYLDGRRPDSVSFTPDIMEDLKRRDFTMNGMAYDPLAGNLLDPHGGKSDISKRIIRAIGDPAERFAEDGLRPLRAVRFAAKLGFEIEEKTFRAIADALPRTSLVSVERIRDELVKTVESPLPSIGFRLMEESGLLGLLLPELSLCRGVEQKGFHDFDVLDHLLSTCDFAPPNRILRLAALFHDIGKPDSMAVGQDGIRTFHNHEQISARMAEMILKRLKFPNKDIESVTHLVRHHMFFYEVAWTDSAVRRFASRVGREWIDSLLELRYADASGMKGLPANLEPLLEFKSRIGSVIEKDEALGIKDLAIDGDDLAALGCPKGKLMGSILKELLETVLDDPGANTSETLTLIAGKLLERSRDLR